MDEAKTAPSERQQAWRAVFVIQTLAVLFTLAVAVPALSLYLQLAVTLSSEAIIDDADIPAALLRPGGLLLLAALVIVWLAIECFSHAAQLHATRDAFEGREPRALRSLNATLRHLRPLSLLALHFTLPALGIALPFLLGIAGILHLQLGKRGLTHYLIEWPPEFIMALMLSSLLALGMLFLLLRHAVRWLLTIPLLFFGNLSPREARDRSRELVEGHQTRLLLQLILRLLAPLAAALVLLVPWLAAMLAWADWVDHRIGLISLGLLAAATLYLGSCMLVRIVAADRFARFHYQLFRSHAAREALRVTPPGHTERRTGWRLAVAAALVIVGLSTFTTIRWLDHLRPDPPVLVIAHRGDSERAPENTLAAIEAAIEAGADWVELDVQHHPSGELFLFHDRDFSRIGGPRRKLRDVALDQISAIDAGSWFAPDFAGERIPTLDQALDRCAGRIGILLELKSYGPRPAFVAALLETLARHPKTDRVMIMSFDAELLERVADEQPGWKLGRLASAPPDRPDALEADFLGISYGILTSELNSRAEKAGLEVFAWTVNDGIILSSAVSRGADALITDRPLAAHRVLAERARMNPAERLLIDAVARISHLLDLASR